MHAKNHSTPRSRGALVAACAAALIAVASPVAHVDAPSQGSNDTTTEYAARAWQKSRTS